MNRISLFKTRIVFEETVVLLGDKRVDGHINIDLDVEKLLKGG